ncbi:unnamed protein product [Somion occarium]|uniref:Aminoacyl-transfer RNA synthetases class-II family profile domain-containing protein n=1 Tax=Somion occarium TaxID=3059160 RepID=A0ABP1D6I6_9APHY
MPVNILTRRVCAKRAHSPLASFPKRTHHCGALTLQDAGSKVVLAGWLLAERKAAKTMSFFPLRDSYGSTQLVVNMNHSNGILASMSQVPTESTVLVEGIVHARPEHQRRPIPSGDIEVEVTKFRLLNAADSPLPFMSSHAGKLPSEEQRLRYRYLDLRRPELSSNLRKRSEVAHIVRHVLHEEGFTEVETPLLFKSTPEGAREFLVPTRLASTSSRLPDTETTDLESHPEPLFYALPQSPQQAKQLLIASGAVDKYYQLARCFRDEDGRKDRQPEFTQIDLEMAFVSWGEDIPSLTTGTADNWRIGGGEVRDIIERLVRAVWSKVEGFELPERFKVMTYAEAMSRFGSDKPDTRFGLEIKNVTSHLPEPLRSSLIEHGEILEALIVDKAEHHIFGRAAKKIKGMEVEKRLDRIDIKDANLESWLEASKAIHTLSEVTPLSTTELNAALGVISGSTVWLAKRPRIAEGGSTPLGQLRLALSEEAQCSGQLTLSPKPHFLWITEFPLFTRADEDKEFLAHGRWSSSHHPFTAPMRQDIEKLYEGRISEVRGQHYDLVLNGVEIGGGSVRVHDASMQEYIFSNVLQLSESETASFSHLIHALRCGAPPHGGIALGFDRLMAILCKTETIRDVIAFPKTGTGKDLLFQSPAPADPAVLEQYNVRPRNGR